MDLTINGESSFQTILDIKQLQEQLLRKEKKLHEKEQKINSLYEEIKSLHDQFTEFYDFNPSAFLTLDKNYQIQAVNFQCAFLLKYDRSQLINRNFLTLVNISPNNTLKKCIQTVLEKQVKQTCELELLSKGEEQKWVYMECWPAKDELVQVVLRDITYIRQLESQQIQLKQSLEILQNLLHNVPDAIATLDEEFYFKIINASFIKIFARTFSIEICSGMNFLTLMADISKYKQELINACDQALLGKETTIVIENTNDQYNANFYFEINFHPVYNPNSQSTEIILLIKDLTKFYLRKKLRMKEQSKLAHAIRLNTMEGMASALAHEINQPLTAIFLYAQTCLLQIQQNNPTNKLDKDLLIFLEKIISQAKQASEIMSRMKSFIHQDEKLSEETDINVLIKDAMIFLNYELTHSKLKINLNLEEELPNLSINRIQVMQVILNLARNSIEAMRTHTSPELTIQTKDIVGYIEIHIRDNGPGITPEHRDRVLHSYFTTKPQGTGLGLTMCRNLVEACGGKLYVKNSEVGAWFIFTLPK
ncbi:PAS domain-containing sensor histidine kinase [Legionella cincinnatiensis]|uniref:histidine kinase n=1 Tax=Legionella cincinnatiensis TaxID=28085 RepID=A0A378IN55_9GAMM|nr:PAS domain-containing sensor histidine kinase [Legionella cincinnatiensis]KTC93420.1 sensor histidine kinase/response regulator LuxN [Legionella cincinnatiensis]STX36579.1 sensor histidine kinase/response regulator LuxN [Legionella cincinnatiensis]